MFTHSFASFTYKKFAECLLCARCYSEAFKHSSETKFKSSWLSGWESKTPTQQVNHCQLVLSTSKGEHEKGVGWEEAYCYFRLLWRALVMYTLQAKIRRRWRSEPWRCQGEEHSRYKGWQIKSLEMNLFKQQQEPSVEGTEWVLEDVVGAETEDKYWRAGRQVMYSLHSIQRALDLQWGNLEDLSTEACHDLTCF